MSYKFFELYHNQRFVELFRNVLKGSCSGNLEKIFESTCKGIDILVKLQASCQQRYKNELLSTNFSGILLTLKQCLKFQ